MLCNPRNRSFLFLVVNLVSTLLNWPDGGLGETENVQLQAQSKGCKAPNGNDCQASGRFLAME